MEVLHSVCCVLDVHKSMVMACLIEKDTKTLRKFGTTTAEPRELAAWLTAALISHALTSVRSNASAMRPRSNPL